MPSKGFAWSSLFVYITIGLVISACGEDRLSYHKTKSTESQTDSVYASASKSRVRALDAWTTPQRLTTEVISDSSPTLFHGPMLETDYRGNAFASWRLHTNLDPATGNFLSGRTTVLRKEPGGNWQSSLPVPVDRQSSSTLPQIVLNKNTGHGIALWRDAGNLFTAHFDPNVGWVQVTDFGPANFGWLSINASGVISAVWFTQDANQLTIFERQYHSGSGWTQTDSISRPGATLLNAAPPVTHDDGTIQFVWFELNGNNNTMMSIEYNNGWLNTKQISDRSFLSLITILDMALATEPDGDANLVYRVLDPSQNSRLMSAHYRRTNGSNWDRPRTIAPGNENSVVPGDSTIAFSTNMNGQQVVAWIGNVSDATTVYAIVYVSRYLTGSGWTQPEAVSAPLALYAIGGPPFGVQTPQIKTPRVVIDPLGEISVLWVENEINVAELFAAHFTPATSWNAPELIASYNGVENTIEQADVAVSKDNAHFVMWRQRIKNTASNSSTHIIWTSEKTGAPGTVVTPPPPVNGSLPAGHIATTNNCGACHNANGSVTVDHNEVIGTCDSCHTKPAAHIAASNVCEACHSTAQWNIVIIVDHSQVIGACVACHNGVVATGKPQDHINTTDQCDACHATVMWAPTITVDHTQVLGTCESCHNNIIASGKPAGHIDTTQDCSNCHTTVSWSGTIGSTPPGTPLPNVRPANHIPATSNCTACHINGTVQPVIVDHNEVLGACIDCHNGVTASGKPSSHIQTTDNCGACHATNVWRPVITVDHREVLGSCASCHNGIVATGKSVTHISSSDICEACHSIATFAPVVTVDHTQVIGSCYDCHNGVVAVGKSASHIPSSNQCQLCHVTTSWLPATTSPTTPPPPTVPSASGWSLPVSPLTLSLKTSALLYGPLLTATNHTNGVLSYIVHDKFNPASGRFESSRAATWIGAVDQNNWNKSLPASDTDMLNANLIKTVRGGTNGNTTYALWSKGRGLFFNRLGEEGTWSSATNIGTVDDDYYLLSNANGGAVAIWYQQLLPDTYVMNASVYSPNGGWSEIQSLQNNEQMFFSAPTIDANGNVMMVAWQSFANGAGQQTISVIYQFTPGGSWQALGVGPILNTAQLLDVNMQIIAARNKNVVLATISEMLPSDVEQTRLATSQSQNNTTWTAFQNVSISDSDTSSVVGESQITNNANGDIMLVWTQSQTSVSGGMTHRVYANYLGENQSQWRGPQRVANLANLFEGQPTIVFRNDGSAVAAWIDDNSVTNSLYTNTFTPNGGWTSTPDVVATYNSNTEGRAMQPKLSLSKDNMLEIAWDLSFFAGSNQINVFLTSYKLP